MRKMLLQFGTMALGVCCVVSGLLAAENAGHKRPRGARLFYRMLGSSNNAPILPKTESAWTQDKQAQIGNTGMADEGVTEYPFCYGLMDFTFVENYAIYPRFISGAQADESRVNVADMVIDHVYEPDGCVWGYTGREFIQTFTATQTELVSATLLVASDPGMFRAALLEGGAGGRQIGPTKTFTSGHSMTYGTVRWTAGQAPLIPGRIYGIRMWREDGQAWTPYLHSTGNCYDGGHLYVDNTPHPETDLATWIVEEPADLKRALIQNADEEGWVYNTRSITFIPRTPNIRLITLSMSPVEDNCVFLVARVRNAEGKVIGGPKYGVACGPVNGKRTAPFIFANDECFVTPGQPYTIEAFALPHVEHQKPVLPGDDEPVQVACDMNARVYGEPDPGTLPGIFNLTGQFVTDSKLKLTWSEPFDCPTTIQTWGLGSSGNTTFDVPAGTTEILIEKLCAGHVYKFRMTSTGPTGLTWNTPIYQVRMPRKDEIEGVIEAKAYKLKEFLPLAPAQLGTGQTYPPLRYRQQVNLTNPGFEEGLSGWKVSPEGVLSAPDVGWTSKTPEKKAGIGTKWGDHLAGFTAFGGENRQQVFQKSTLTQDVSTTPGHVYVLSGWINTSIEEKGENHPRGDTRARLFAKPAGDSGDESTSQWYWTDGQWLRFQHQFTAQSDQTTVGFGFFRWRDLDRASAYVDSATLYDLGPAPATVDAPAVRRAEIPKLVLIDPKVEASDKVEGFLQAPPGYVITGIGARAHYDNITTMWMRVQPLMPDGTLGEPEELRTGWEADANLEAEVKLPEGYVMTGFGAGIAPEWDVKRLLVWGRPMNKDGTLGEEKLFRGGVDQKSGAEKEIRLPEGRVLTSAGLNCMLNDVNGIKGSSAQLTLSAEAKAK